MRRPTIAASSGLRLQGFEPGGPTNQWVGYSQFLPGGGAGPDSTPFEKVYVVLEGHMTVIVGGEGDRAGPDGFLHHRARRSARDRQPQQPRLQDAGRDPLSAGSEAMTPGSPIRFRCSTSRAKSRSSPARRALSARVAARSSGRGRREARAGRRQGQGTRGDRREMPRASAPKSRRSTSGPSTRGRLRRDRRRRPSAGSAASTFSSSPPARTTSPRSSTWRPSASST